MAAHPRFGDDVPVHRTVAGAWCAGVVKGADAIREDGRTVDALAPAAEEGRGHAAKRLGEALAAGDPTVSEWGNPPGVIPGHPSESGGHVGN